MTAESDARIDPILSIRLELLAQALDEVDKISDAMKDQRKQLGQVEERLRNGGKLSGSEKDLEEALNDAESRLKLVLPDGGDGDGEETRPDPTSGLTPAADRRLRAALGSLAQARDALRKLCDERTSAHNSFADVRRWSVAGLANRELESAATGYRRSLLAIRESPEPWKQYQEQLHGHGPQLFTRYLELLGGMAVRGLGPDVVDDASVLVPLLLAPEQSASISSPLLMGTRHLQLGYPEWNLWTLPLRGRQIAENLIDSETFITTVPDGLRAVCADVYLLHVLGPSYAFAAIFIGLNPGDASAITPADSVRAQVLIERLPQLCESGPLQQSLAEIAARLAEPWARARDAFGGEVEPLGHAAGDVVDRYFSELRTDFAEAAYNAERLPDAERLSKQLVSGREDPNDASPNLKDLLTAIWLARLEHPDKGRQIHQHASRMRNRRQSGGRPSDLSARPDDLRRRPRIGA